MLNDDIGALCRLLDTDDPTTKTRLRWLRTTWPALADRLCDILFDRGQPVPRELLK